jgi:hypothetical protein
MLQKLDRRMPPATAAPDPGDPSAVEQITGWLARKGIVRGEMESMADTLARVLGIGTRDVRALL